jgi:hypothetical protein
VGSNGPGASAGGKPPHETAVAGEAVRDAPSRRGGAFSRKGAVL